MPLPKVTINNVSMDYFLHGVEATKPQGTQPVQSQVNGGTGAVEAQKTQSAGKMVAQLDVLLMKAAKASTKSLDGRTVKTTLKKLVDDGVLSSDSLKLLANAADTAAKTLKALNKFTGRELSAAFDAHGLFDPTTTKAGKAVAAALKAQQELSDLLAQLGKNLDAISRNDGKMRQANPQYKGVDVELFNKVNDFRQLCDRRAAEIYSLPHLMKDFALHLATKGENSDPNIAVILKTKVDELLPRQALAMHGTADALSTVSQDVSGKLRPLAERIDAFRNNPSATVDSKEFNALQSDITTMKAALLSIRTDGVKVIGGRMMVDKDIIEALEKEVAKVEEQFKTVRKDVTRTVLSNYLETVVSLFSGNPVNEARHSSGSTRLTKVLDLRDKMLLSMQTLCNAVISIDKKSDLEPYIKDFANKAQELQDAADEAERLPGQSAEEFNTIIGRCQGIGPVAVDFIFTVRRMHGSDKFLTGVEAAGVFNGTISVSSFVEARARGLQVADVDPANEDANIVSERVLGSGVAGTVYDLERSDGTHVVFKGETESRTGLNIIAAGSGRTYDIAQQAVNLNFASKSAAVALGMGRMIVDYSAGTHNGVFGFYMEKAKGQTGLSFGAGKTSGTGMSPKEIKNLPSRQRQQIKADIMRELNRLQWLDLVTGQNDRHWENYFIHVDRDTHQVTVKGIDNDASYSRQRVGAVTFALDSTRTATFKALLRNLAREISSSNAAAEFEHLMKDPGITTDEKGHIIVDATKIQNRAIGHVVATLTGVHSLVIPDRIDRTTYDALIRLKSGRDRQQYLDSIRPRLSDDSYNAAVSRLDDVIAKAEALGREGKIVEEDGWLDVQETPRESGKVSVPRQNGGEKRLGGDIAHNVHEVFCPSYFARDRVSKVFD